MESCRKALKAAEAALAAAVAEVETAAADRAKLEAQKADMQASLKGGRLHPYPPGSSLQPFGRAFDLAVLP